MIAVIKNLEVHYNLGGEQLKVLDIPNWSVASGEQIAIVGPSGSGKSTLLHVLAGLLLSSSGTVGRVHIPELQPAPGLHCHRKCVARDDIFRKPEFKCQSGVAASASWVGPQAQTPAG